MLTSEPRARLLWISAAPPSPEAARLGAWKWASAEEALQEMAAAPANLVLATFPLEDWTAEELLEQAQRLHPLAPVIICDPELNPSRAFSLAKLGAFQCVTQNEQELTAGVESALEEIRRRELAAAGVPEASWKRLLVGESRAMREVEYIIRLVGNKRCTVLISGETGTGKEMAARALHMVGKRAHLPMVAFNCAAFPENLLEAELFGHVKGAFTGAVNSRVGRFEQAHNSTLFLDEIGDLPLDLQVKLLRVLQEREFQRLGSSETIKVDVRVIAASNVNLLERVRQGKFREDLYYRLSVVPVHMPPLRQRLSDMPLLVQHFIEKVCAAEDVVPKTVGLSTLQRLCSYSWPGNVRELENAVEMAVALSGDRVALYPSDFPLGSAARERTIATAKPPAALPDEGLDFDTAVTQFERAIIEQAMHKARGNKTAAAGLLGLKRTTLLAKLRNFELDGLAIRTA